MEYLTDEDIAAMLAKLEITQAVKHGEPKELTLLERYKTYGTGIFEGLPLKEKQEMLIEIAEAMANE